MEPVLNGAEGSVQAERKLGSCEQPQQVCDSHGSRQGYRESQTSCKIELKPRKR